MFSVAFAAGCRSHRLRCGLSKVYSRLTLLVAGLLSLETVGIASEVIVVSFTTAASLDAYVVRL